MEIQPGLFDGNIQAGNVFPCHSLKRLSVCTNFTAAKASAHMQLDFQFPPPINGHYPVR